MSVRQRNLLLSIQNPYVGDIAFVNGLPTATRPGHGLGTRSIASIVNQHGGLVHFSANNGVFLLRATLPMC
jgi:nitrogen-specific signal transduction histidine kinase